VPESRPTLLFVDDEADVVDLLGQLFRRSYDVITARSGAEALEMLRTRRIDLLVTDQKMPEMTGLELVAAARAQAFDVTAILLTGYTDPDDLIAAINSGHIYRYLTKPWEVRDLMLAVQQALEFTQLRRDKERLSRQLERRVEALSVLYEVSRGSTPLDTGYDALIERVLVAIERVLPYDCGAALIAPGGPRKATLRLRCRARIGEAGLVEVKEATLGSWASQTGATIREDQLILHVTGSEGSTSEAVDQFPSALHVPLKAHGRQLGTLSLFARRAREWTADDGALLETLANQTTGAVLALRATEDDAHRRVERLVESMPEGVLLTDEKNALVVVNPAARHLLRLGEDPEGWTGKRLAEQLGFHPFELARGGRGEPIREELRLHDRDLQIAVTPVDDGSGMLRGVGVTLRDVTEQRQLNERKDEFVSMVSHELRTPLTSISGALDLVLSGLTGEVNEKQARYLGMAKESTESLNAIVDDLLDLAKFDRGRLRMDFRITWMDEVVSRSVERFGPSFLERGLSVTTELPQLPLRMIADPDRLSQVIGNLLTNAVKFTPQNGEIRIGVAASPDAPGFATLSIWNSGEAIAEPDLERIFERFEQARSVRTRTVKGTGLGLSISRSIVEAHGGSLWAEPVADGARFVMVLPAEPAPEILENEAAPPPSNEGPFATVLVVEDDAETAFVIKALLRSRGHRVLLAGDADEGLQVARTHRPGLIVLDVRLPDVDGLALAEIFQHDPDTSHTPLMVISAFDERDRAFRLGASAFLRKPLQAAPFLASVDGLLRRPAQRIQGRVLVVDDDPSIVAICDEVLRNLGFEVELARGLEDARSAVRARRPDVLLLDVGLPDGEGYALLEELQVERSGPPLSVIFVSARADTASKVKALRLGADDYLVKPFDALELGARVESVMRRREQGLGASPTTQLPGSGAIEREVMRRLSNGARFAFCYLDLDNFKAYNDRYGFAKADGVIRQTGDFLREIFEQEGAEGDFLGHVAGDDFVFVTAPESVDRICRRAVETFDRIIPLYYDRADRERGCIEAEDRYGEQRRFPVMSVSVVSVLAEPGMQHADLARAAADLKRKAKSMTGSVYLRGDEQVGARSA